jgi:hypothetical protein
MASSEITIDKLKYTVGKETYDKGVAMYEAGKIKSKSELGEKVFELEVQGTQTYSVTIYLKAFDYSFCDCYVGQKNIYCKHLVAAALSVIKNDKPLTKQERAYLATLEFSNKLGELTADKLEKFEQEITKNMKYIKLYSGSSRYWDAYQASLCEGVDRMIPIISKLPVSLQTAKILVKILLRLEKKLMNGVDDSDGTVGDFMIDIVELLKKFIKKDANCLKAVEKLQNMETTSFNWEKDLLLILNAS